MNQNLSKAQWSALRATKAKARTKATLEKTGVLPKKDPAAKQS